jgi:transposase-like protein
VPLAVGDREHSALNFVEARRRHLQSFISTNSLSATQAARLFRQEAELIYLAITNATPKWTRVAGWTKALRAFKIHFGDRLSD